MGCAFDPVRVSVGAPCKGIRNHVVGGVDLRVGNGASGGRSRVKVVVRVVAHVGGLLGVRGSLRIVGLGHRRGSSATRG